MHVVFVHCFKCSCLQSYARDKLERSGTGGNTGNPGTHSLRRTSKQTWLEYRGFDINVTELVDRMPGAETQEETVTMLEDAGEGWHHFFMTKEHLNTTDRVAKRVSDRMERATTFQLWSPYTSESFQVANYGLGGQYQTHLDPHGYWEGTATAEMSELTGDRLATVMVYLEGVAAGGATAFPNTGVMVPVTRGAAAFWVNLRTSGTIDR